MRSSDAFTVRRCQILLASARSLGCTGQTVRNAIHAFHEQGLTARRVAGETVRVTLRRQGVRWRRAKPGITSPDPEYTTTKPAETG